jgi:hypothetical protein
MPCFWKSLPNCTSASRDGWKGKKYPSEICCPPWGWKVVAATFFLMLIYSGIFIYTYIYIYIYIYITIM